jgi:peptidoglycan/xylan/chitin deacetylase (PgdA/CDA1 family)
MYLVKTPIFIQKLFPNFIWRLGNVGKKIFLSFDDGPIPEVTPWVLDLLKEYNAKATFFCVGENVEKYPDLLQRLVYEGHCLGNHTYNHLNGWGTENIPYFHNVRRGASTVKSELFRPPYGRLKPRQAQFLQRHYSIVMWDVLSGDFDPAISEEQCFQNVIQHATPGSIVVFHDSLKSWRILEKVLPRVLKYYTDRGYQFESLNWKQTKNHKKSA